MFFVGLSTVYGQQHKVTKAVSFGEYEGYVRCYDQGVYSLRNLENGEVTRFESYSYISDVSNGIIVFKNQAGKYGVMNLQFEELVKPEWLEVKDFGFGYLALAHQSGKTIKEDRGAGVRDYPLLSWRIYSLHENRLVSEMELINPICIYGDVLAKTTNNHEVKIQLGKINFGYTDPLLKALEYIHAAESGESTNERLSKY